MHNVKADTGVAPSVTAYATKSQLMNSFAPNEDVTSNYEITYESGKLVKEDDISNIVSPDLGNNTVKWLCMSLIAGAIVVATVFVKRR